MSSFAMDSWMVDISEGHYGDAGEPCLPKFADYDFIRKRVTFSATSLAWIFFF